MKQVRFTTLSVAAMRGRRKPEDYEAFVRVLHEGLCRYAVDLFSFTLIPKHWHLVLRSAEDGEMGRMLRWVTATHTRRYHAHYHTSGEGHIYQGALQELSRGR